MPTALASVAGVSRRFLHRDPRNFSIDGIEGHINPSSVRTSVSQTHYEQQTLTGTISYRYNATAPVWMLQGDTGIAGLSQIEAMQRFQPQSGRRQKQLIPFTYPNIFKGIKWVYVNSFSLSVDSQNHLYYSYELELVEFPKKAPASAGKLANTATLGVAIVPTPGGNQILGTSSNQGTTPFTGGVGGSR